MPEWYVIHTYIACLVAVLMDMVPSVSFPFPVIMAVNNVPGANQMFFL